MSLINGKTRIAIRLDMLNDDIDSTDGEDGSDSILSRLYAEKRLILTPLADLEKKLDRYIMLDTVYDDGRAGAYTSDIKYIKELIRDKKKDMNLI